MNQFDRVPVKIPARNVFNLSHDVKGTYNFDNLYPFMCQVVYPGDTWNARAEVFLRTQPALAPIMHNVDLRMWFVYVPFRLVWNANKKSDWRTFITGGEDGTYGWKGPKNDEREYPVLPHFTYGALAALQGSGAALTSHGSLLDHMGFASFDNSSSQYAGEDNVKVCSLPFRAYQFTWNELFRNQNVQNEVEFSYDEGPETDDNLLALFTMRKKCWEKDYFTSCLPFQQRGEVMYLPIDFGQNDELNLIVSTDRAVQAGTQGTGYALGTDEIQNVYVAGNTMGSKLIELQGATKIEAGSLSFTGVSAGTINDFRYCLRLQQWLENNARCGSRYIEQIFAHFGVRSSDARLQRPELLGGGKVPLIFSDVPQTSYGSGSDRDVVGDLAGKGTLYGKTGGFKKNFEEHGVLLGLLSIIPRTSYAPALPRQWTAFDKTDWYFPEFAHLGEQAVLNKEVWYNPKSEGTVQNPNYQDPDGVFGYQGRFTELRYIPSSIHGELLDDLAYWHFGRLWDASPVLNENFVQADTRADVWALSNVAESGYDPFIAQIHLDIKALRPLPKFAVPTL